MLRIESKHADTIRQHALRDYPRECCGVLLGSADGGEKLVRDVVLVPNLRSDPQRSAQFMPLRDPAQESARNSYFIDPVDLLRTMKDGRSRSLEVVGYYHSHPGQSAQPSARDRELAWPGYSYLIVAVEGSEVTEMTCWILLGDGGLFGRESLEFVAI